MAVMDKAPKNNSEENLREMLERIRHENEALQHLINALKEQSKPITKKILNK
jgi:hypothetical protein